VPRGTPEDIIERLNREINAGLADSAVKARLASVATTPMVFSPAEFGGCVKAETEKWGRVVMLAGVKPE
jgi:tripartite-type tricarboxylate transporter receptor subunit TctC